MTLIEYLKTLFPIDIEVESFFESIIETKSFQKGEDIFSVDSYLKYIYFVESGFTRIYYYKNNKDITHYFFGESTFTTGIESLFYDKPSPFGLQAIIPTKVTLLPFSPVKAFADKNLTMNKIIQKVLLDGLISFSKRFYNNQFETALERYQSLINENPVLFQNASLGHIASYLGVSQQTLSVIRGMK